MSDRISFLERPFFWLVLVSVLIGSGMPESAVGGELVVSSNSDHGDKRVVVEKHVLRHDRPAVAFVGSRAFLGVEMIGLSSELREHFGVPSDAGVMVSRVQPDSPAQLAGIEVGDILTSIDSIQIKSPSGFAMEIAHRSQGDTVSLEAWRGGRLESLQATLEERNRPMVDIRSLHLEDHMKDMDVKILQLEVPEFEGDLATFATELEFDPEVLNQALDRLNEELSSPEWHQRVQRLSEHEHGLQERIEELEKRLLELERELESLPDGR
jgi:membrane-associated protease RseP (regulator of RpoE activity)